MKRETKLLKRAREKAGLTQKTVSDYLGFSTSQLISNAERGLCGLPKDSIVKFCRLTGLDEEEYFYALVADFKNKLHEEIF